MTSGPSAKLLDLLRKHIHWQLWEQLIESNGIVIDRPEGGRHPRYPEIVYPIDYGYIEGTSGTDLEEVDVFVGSASSGLLGGIVTDDFRRGDREMKLIYNCSAREVYVVNGFLNFAPDLMRAWLVLRRPLEALWE